MVARVTSTAALLAMLLLPRPAQAQESTVQWWLFEGRSYHDPLIAGVREPHIGALGLAWADRMDFQVSDDDPRRVWDIDLGYEIPILGRESASSTDGSRVDDGEWAVGLWIPIDFHMIEDFADASNPIVNTDYRFGAMLKVQFGVSGSSWVSGRVSAGHESTHLGDEFSLAGQDAFTDTFERVNVSWEFLDVALLYERVIEASFVSGRLGLTTTVPFGDSYYSVDSMSATQSAVGPVILSHNSVDPYAGFQVEWEEVLGDSPGWGIYASTEFRYRSVYDYHRASEDVAEDRQLSVNLIAGLKKPTGGGPIATASPYLRFYHGVNPHGQFRNQRGFTLVGLGLRLTL